MQSGMAAFDTNQKQGNIVNNNLNRGNTRQEKPMTSETATRPVLRLTAAAGSTVQVR